MIAKTTEPSKTRWGRCVRWLERIFAITGVFFVVYHICFAVDVVVSPSMSPTIRGESWETGDWVLTERVSSWFRSPQRWNLIRFRDAEGMLVMKRVVAFPGETVAIADDQLMINGQPIARPKRLQHLKYYSYGNMAKGKSLPVEKGYYVLGDNSRDSQDSRYEGPVLPDKLTGRPWLIVWPLSRIGFLNP